MDFLYFSTSASDNFTFFGDLFAKARHLDLPETQPPSPLKSHRPHLCQAGLNSNADFPPCCCCQLLLTPCTTDTNLCKTFPLANLLVIKKLFNAGVNKLSVMAVRVGDSFNCRSDRTPKLNRNVMWDPGCNIVISNNKSDFIGPMVPYKTSLGLADANMSSMVTHKGTIRLNGKLVDALYGPTLNKTLVSGGWLFRLGYIPQHSWSGRKDIVDKKGDVWMSFHIAEDNLYYLVEENTRIVANSA
jgi:hypothetical protein